ncbi:hypothetical protein HPP92_011357 [Vanilla planifolia]|uniref:UspA domain-containing protein n=1 Tax=Vanilla planifolia TaxID=51239 RepID=A0A835RBB9_VANPL|nr:hypothetical protein HPP92_011651 [Vanilla planifolia]KAG0483273.1 hypothetical protein HPP92_011357 [Vanilla planifolia]
MGSSDIIKMASFKLRRLGSRARSRSPKTFESAPISGTVEEPQGGDDDATEGTKAFSDKKIVIVVDSTCRQESKVALQWALSHAVQSQDTVVLLLLVKSSYKLPNNPNFSFEGETDSGSRRFLCAMKRICQDNKPEVPVELCLAEGKDKGSAIVDVAKKQGAGLLVLGRRKKRPTFLRILMPWRRRRGSCRGAVVDYCIRNASCMAVGVRRRGRNGGYLISTKKHRDFWLLA